MKLVKCVIFVVSVQCEYAAVIARVAISAFSFSYYYVSLLLTFLPVVKSVCDELVEGDAPAVRRLVDLLGDRNPLIVEYACHVLLNVAGYGM